jgi:hypothetical protein
MTPRIAAVTAASSSSGRSIIGTVRDIIGRGEVAKMPRDFVTLADFPKATISIECKPCGRRGRYNVARLMEKYGDAKLPDLRHTLANCLKANSHSIHDRCRVRYGEDSRF